MAELGEYLLAKLLGWGRLKNVPEPVIHECIEASLAFLSELPTDVVENTDVAILDTLLHTNNHQVCVKCDAIVPTRLAVQEEPQLATTIPRPAMCVECWNKLAIAEGRVDDIYCLKCGRIQPCENSSCAKANSNAS